ncbi:flagellar M-ring protein FliF [Hydrogenophaga crassostreae]|uniref:Flagellar M-ring protein n=1 Tax=Hydrogenophaga crassostreae TaxID=1763535 RepID=A0A162SWI4_9BURK|nr:flagellar basal-body MS-ring/collar protein FliF [Hydrogenophaga crassostreae]AOW12223.1 flagellar M-ring protein FliF [Hydrogenophaga crassostreae]OAD41169.1 flagellar M-ring protein FliF [Hydrogenophaga crassostreae]
MSNTVAEMDMQPPRQNAFGAGLARMDRTQKTRLGLGAFALLAIALSLFFMGQQPDWRVLFANLNDKDGGAIVAQLAQMNVPYKYTEGGQAIMVPSDQVHDTRLRLASQGLPKGSVNGFELMESSRFGTTQFQERLTFQRGLEGELTRSIQSLSSVQSARIHLALPNQNGFFREQQKPSASVLLTLYPGRTLDKSQIAGIVHLIASSVPEMNPKDVSVVDDAGTLLSVTPDGQSQGADSEKLKYAQQIEQLYTRRILDMIEPLVGVGNVKAQVSADIDFSLVESTSEQHRPNQSAETGAIRSQQLVEDGTPPVAQPAGVPGATSNQPPATGIAPINGTAAPLAAGGNADQAAKSRRESVINYEVDKTVKVVREASGTVRRLSAAVVVNHRSITDAKSGKVSSAPIPPEQLEQMTALVRETIGFSKDRGDSVNVMNAEFNVAKPIEVEEVPLWRQPENIELAKSLAWPLGMLGMGLLVLMGMIRPGIKLMKAPAVVSTEPVVPQLNAMLNEETERPGLPMPEPENKEPSVDMVRLADAKRLALANPVAVANIVKGWVNGEATAGA